MCDTPIKIRNAKVLKNSDYAFHMVPCGKCPACLRKRANNWAFRLSQQEKQHKNGLFITLTYTPDTVPITSSGYMSLRKTDVQQFFKRLRKNTGRKTIKYYACGEYGGKTERPHYHAIIFDVQLHEVESAWSIDKKPIGHVHAGDVTGASTNYTLKYMQKTKRIPLHDKDDRQKEFSLMSKKMGLNYLTPEIISWHKQDLKSYVVLPGGAEQSLPRYFRDKIFTDVEKDVMNISAQQHHQKTFEENVNEHGSEREFYRVQFERIKAKFRQFNSAAQSRDKI